MSDVGRDPLRSTTVVVVNWDEPELTIRCVTALVGDGVPPDRIVVVENGSAEASTAHLHAALPECRVVVLERNIGYARASNAGARSLEGGTYLLVNNDAFVERPGSVRRLVESSERDGVGIAVPRLLNEDLTLQPSVAPISTPANAFVRATGLSRFIPNRWQPKWSTYWDHERSQLVDAAKGSVTAVRGELWRELGGYAERDLMFSEDLDLCWRARKRGWRTWFERDSEFVHLGGATVGRTRTDTARVELVSKSDATMIRSELSPARAALVIGFLSVGFAARVGLFALARKPERAEWARASLRGYLSRPVSPT
jgi:GT2 family glycosyltransferase